MEHFFYVSFLASSASREVPRCVRSMCRITMAQTIKHRITFKSLFERLGVGSFDSYYNRRLLRWTGHVVRIPMDRMPRELLTGWVEHARPVGCPREVTTS